MQADAFSKLPAAPPSVTNLDKVMEIIKSSKTDPLLPNFIMQHDFNSKPVSRIDDRTNSNFNFCETEMHGQDTEFDQTGRTEPSVFQLGITKKNSNQQLIRTSSLRFDGKSDLNSKLSVRSSQQALLSNKENIGDYLHQTKESLRERKSRQLLNLEKAGSLKVEQYKIYGAPTTTNQALRKQRGSLKNMNKDIEHIYDSS